MNFNFLSKLTGKVLSGTSQNGSGQKSSTLNKITFIIVGSMVFSIIFAVFVSIYVFDLNFNRDTTNSITHISNGALRIIEDWANNLRTLTASVATRPDIIEAVEGDKDAAYLEELISDMQGQSDFDIMAITNKDGIIIEGGGYNAESGDDLSDTRSFQNAVIDNPILTFESIGTLDFVMAVCMPVRNSYDEIVGTVLFAYDLTDDFYTNFIKDGFDADCTVFKGNVRVSTSLTEVDKGSTLENQKIADMVLYNGGLFIGKSKVGKSEYICCYQPLMSEDGQTDGMLFVAKDLALVRNISRKVLFVAIPTTIILVALSVLIIMNAMGKMRKREKGVAETLFAETQNLVVASKENAATAQDQSAAVKEIVATMEDQNSLSENIAQKIKDVAGVANNTNQNVRDGVKYLEANVAQLHEIAGANQNTIDGIKSLGDKIENIWDIVTLINSVADQAKIIAFNAELEASSAGEAGKNFHIVATEIRRLADGIIDGTKEIKASINEIQQSSDSLILASESGTEKIKEGVENAKGLEAKFSSIRNASEITAESANDITTIIQQQAMASEQILITLKQISAGVENFGAATDNISNASQRLKELAEDMTR